MPLLGFDKQFADLVESGAKRQTIRAFRKDGRAPKKGDRLFFWTGAHRPGKRRKIGEAVCTRSTSIEIARGSIALTGGADPMDVTRIFSEDGFTSFEAFYNYIERAYGLPFSGLLIRWDEVELPTTKATD